MRKISFCYYIEISKISMLKKFHKFFHGAGKGQASAEYLLILAVVLVISLVAVYLVSSSVSMAPEEKEKIGLNAWAGAYPISVKGIVWNGSSMYFYVKNNGLEKLTIRFMRFSPYAAASMNVALNPQEERRISFGVWPSCPGSGIYFEFREFYFKYDKESITNLTQRVTVTYVGRCV